MAAKAKNVEAFIEAFKWRFLNPVKHLRWNSFLKQLTALNC